MLESVPQICDLSGLHSKYQEFSVSEKKQTHKQTHHKRHDKHLFQHVALLSSPITSMNIDRVNKYTYTHIIPWLLGRQIKTQACFSSSWLTFIASRANFRFAFSVGSWVCLTSSCLKAQVSKAFLKFKKLILKEQAKGLKDTTTLSTLW